MAQLVVTIPSVKGKGTKVCSGAKKVGTAIVSPFRQAKARTRQRVVHSVAGIMRDAVVEAMTPKKE